MADGPLLAGQAFDAEATALALTYQAIVRDLAAVEPTTQLGDTPYEACSLCGAHNDPPGQPYTSTPAAVVHDEACPWNRARALFPQ